MIEKFLHQERGGIELIIAKAREKVLLQYTWEKVAKETFDKYMKVVPYKF